MLICLIVDFFLAYMNIFCIFAHLKNVKTKGIWN